MSTGEHPDSALLCTSKHLKVHNDVSLYEYLEITTGEYQVVD